MERDRLCLQGRGNHLIISRPKELIAAFVNVRQGFPANASWGNYTALGLMRDGHLIAGAIYNCFEGANANIHIAADGHFWLTPDFLRAGFVYPFLQLGKRRITAFMPAGNKRAIRLAEKLGFSYEGTLRHYYPQDDAVNYGMLREECRFLEMRKAA